jgi:hypothetical protein
MKEENEKEKTKGKRNTREDKENLLSFNKKWMKDEGGIKICSTLSSSSDF